MLAIALTLALSSPPDLPTIHFDRIDLNHTHRSDGTPSFSQLIFWRWVRDEKRFVSFGYVMVEDDRRYCGDVATATAA